MPKAGGKSTALTAKKPKGSEKVVTDDDIAFKKKQAEETKKLKEAQAKLVAKKKK